MLTGRVLMSRRFRFAHDIDGAGSIARNVDFAGTPFVGLSMAARERVFRDRNTAPVVTWPGACAAGSQAKWSSRM